MKDDNKRSVFRRGFLTATGTAVTTGLAGCMGDEGDPSSKDGTSKEASTPTQETTENNNTGTGNQESSQLDKSPLYEEDESDTEKETERGYTSLAEGWIELENPSEQLPEEYIESEDFPGLSVLEVGESPLDIDPYDTENGSTYIFWGAYPKDGTYLGVDVWESDEYEERDGAKTTTVYKDGDPIPPSDIDEILEEAVKGVTDVSQNISDEHARILLEK